MMNKNKIFNRKNIFPKNLSALLVFIFLIGVLSGCSFNNQSTDQGEIKRGLPFSVNTKEVRVCFTKSIEPEKLSLVSVKRRVSKDDSVVNAVLKELFLGPTKKEEIKGVMTEIPTGTRLLEVEESDDDILVDLSSQFLTGGGSATMQLRYLQIYKSLKTIAPHKDIYLLVDGKSIKAIGGEGLEVTQPLTTIPDYTKKYEKVDELQP